MSKLRGLLMRIIITFTFLFCAGSLTYSYTGEAGPPMLKMVYGSRALSLGGAFVGLSDDAFYIDSNPAGGDTRSIYKVSILHQEWIEDVNYEAIRFTGGIADRFFFGVGFTNLYLPFVYYDYYGETTGNTHIISQSLGILNFGYNFKQPNISVGTNLKIFYNHIPEELYPGQSYWLFASDIGFIWRTNLLKRYIGPEPSMVFGLALKNLGYSGMIEKLPIEVHAGASYRLFKSLLFTAEIAVPIFEQIYGSFGVELDIYRQLFLEGGIQIKENPMFAFGLGYRSKEMRINVSYTPTVEFSNMISVSFSYYFGETKEEERTKRITAFIIKALEYYREERYLEALDALNTILAMHPTHRQALRLKATIETKMLLKQKLEKQEREAGTQ